MDNFLNKPFISTGSNTKKFLSLVAFALFIFLFLFLFKPFGISETSTLIQLFITFGYGLVTFFVLVVFKFLIEPVLITDKWTFGKELLWDILISATIGVVNFFYSSMVTELRFSIVTMLYFMWTALLVGSIPVSIYLILEYNKACEINLEKDGTADFKNVEKEELVITAGIQANCFRICPANLIYICSNDNYVTFVTLKDGQTVKTTLRGTLKSVEEELGENSRLVRCHKSYIVNLDHIESLTGNSQNLKIRIKDQAIEVPVARPKAGYIIKKVTKQ